MSIETLELAIEEAQTQLDGREARRLFGWAVISALLFFVPVVLFVKLSSGDVFGNNYAPIMIVWLMVSLGLGNAVAAALFSGRTVELRLAIASASLMLEQEKSSNAVAPQANAE